MLARVRDFRLAQVLVEVVQAQLDIGHVSVRSVCKVTDDGALMQEIWQSMLQRAGDIERPLLNETRIYDAEAAASGTTLLSCRPFFDGLTSSCEAAQALLEEVSVIVNEVTAGSIVT